ncbi:glycoside hydrolase family 35 protein [Aspergillus aculeatus ATCC 16872]|uniref:Glycoside hydrolase family 35 protein n=1 Tax=Aspergillus aculeatus (strain ATCC 16872 / CBS 172.66 / WB 5094) TaxID=690307 RepID=A0A1L9WMD4_ASPA1|nr:glycoside hydrolase family 35 protein [Aspergillus aculeatus ATCC 16872]OJJ97260.1 glycoside hydrolase family 35 protein [Aspergillus aculeatus ATCC 16872]
MAPPAGSRIPHLRPIENGKQLVVHGRPFLVLPGMLQLSSSFTSPEYTYTVWQKLVDAHVNTVLGRVAWEETEPFEGHFLLDKLDEVILGARKHGLHLVLLWCGSFHELIGAGAARAFARLMRHLKEIDSDHSTTLMVQVENATASAAAGLLAGDSRDTFPAAEERFAQPVSSELVSFLTNDWDHLQAGLQRTLGHFKSQSRPSFFPMPRESWAEVFGRGPHTDELFMAYHSALYYPLPLYTQLWEKAEVGKDEKDDIPTTVTGEGGTSPVDYHYRFSGDLLDIWQWFAPSLDFVAPSRCLLGKPYARVWAQHRHHAQPLFLSEPRHDENSAGRIWTACVSYQALGVSPLGIDTLEPAISPFTKHYRLLSSISQTVLLAQQLPSSSVKFHFDDDNDDDPMTGERKKNDPVNQPIVREYGDYEIQIERCPSTADTAAEKGRPLLPSSGMVIHRGGGNFLLIGWGFRVHAKATGGSKSKAPPKAAHCSIEWVWEKAVANRTSGRLRLLRRIDHSVSMMNGFLHSTCPGKCSACFDMPAEVNIAEVEFRSF